MEDNRMGMHTDEWLEHEKEQFKKYYISLDKNKYQLDFIKIPFGNEYIPIPQDRRLTSILTSFGNYSLERAVKNGVFWELVERTGLKSKMDEDGNIEFTSEDFKKIDDAMEGLIFEKGPYYVISQAYSNSYNWEMEYFLRDGEEPFQGFVTEKSLVEFRQEHKDEAEEAERMYDLE